MKVQTPLFLESKRAMVLVDQAPIIGKISIHQFTLDVTFLAIDDSRGNSYGFVTFESDANNLETQILLAMSLLHHCDDIRIDMTAVDHANLEGMKSVVIDTLNLVGLPAMVN